MLGTGSTRNLRSEFAGPRRSGRRPLCDAGDPAKSGAWRSRGGGASRRAGRSLKPRRVRARLGVGERRGRPSADCVSTAGTGTRHRFPPRSLEDGSLGRAELARKSSSAGAARRRRQRRRHPRVRQSPGWARRASAASDVSALSGRWRSRSAQAGIASPMRRESATAAANCCQSGRRGDPAACALGDGMPDAPPGRPARTSGLALAVGHHARPRQLVVHARRRHAASASPSSAPTRRSVGPRRAARSRAAAHPTPGRASAVCSGCSIQSKCVSTCLNGAIHSSVPGQAVTARSRATAVSNSGRDHSWAHTPEPARRTSHTRSLAAATAARSARLLRLSLRDLMGNRSGAPDARPWHIACSGQGVASRPGGWCRRWRPGPSGPACSGHRGVQRLAGGASGSRSVAMAHSAFSEADWPMSPS